MFDSGPGEKNPIQEPEKSIYKYLTAEEKLDLEDYLTRASIRKNHFIFKEGELPSGFIILEEGKVKIIKEGVGKREQIIRLVKPGGIVGYRALLANEKHISSAVALEESVINIIDAGYFFNHFLKNNEFVLHLFKKIARELGFSNSRMVTLTQKHIRGRLAESIILLKNKYGTEPDGTTLKANLSREDLANLSNMTSPNAIRTLSDFVLERVIDIKGRKLKILDLNKLEQISKMG
jgi:CRP-like cAMP-binding protein